MTKAILIGACCIADNKNILSTLQNLISVTILCDMHHYFHFM